METATFRCLVNSGAEDLYHARSAAIATIDGNAPSHLDPGVYLKGVIPPCRNNRNPGDTGKVITCPAHRVIVHIHHPGTVVIENQRDCFSCCRSGIDNQGRGFLEMVSHEIGNLPGASAPCSHCQSVTPHYRMIIVVSGYRRVVDINHLGVGKLLPELLPLKIPVHPA